MTDDDAGEQCAVRKAFGNEEGIDEIPVTHLLCTVHSKRTLDRNLLSSSPLCVESQKHLLAALFNRKTKEGCEESIKNTILKAPDQRKKLYIEKKWWNTQANWANCARCHSAILLQHTSTNAVESWHRVLKDGQKAAMSKWTFSGIICHIANKALDYDQRAKLAAKQFRTYQLSDVALYLGLAKLPHPAQKLTIIELARAHEIIEEGERPEKPLKDDVACDCLFWRRYCLPCRHIWLQDHIFG